MDGFDARDQELMARALQLAARGLWTARPNPMVGCVIARDGEIVGEGWHPRTGEPHAEVFALRDAGERARGATAYVTLEPCAHHGRTPPCADALVAAGVARVVAAMRDPFPRVDGAGFARLRAAGIEVASGLLEDEARELNRGFLSRVQRGRPWLRIKLAASLDGRTAMASGESKWITGEAARADVQRWRARSSAILTGADTVLADDPALTARVGEGADLVPPLRVVLDSRLRSLERAKVRDGSAPTLYLHGPDGVPPPGLEAEFAAVPLRDGHLDLEAALRLLGERGVNELQVEAGPALCGALLRAGLVDELLLYQAPLLLGDAARPLFAGLGLDTMAQALRFEVVDEATFGSDRRLLLRPRQA
ncbi:bifunctional diaminohydroxyphosphoribosylaminopyrimidine deaminase/5-amino-6-(5-phosphoribosylamino)uracil reductase RibD [Pseudoxanthomonas suwonensis]|uniref:bifunctional diaminohydroxyphosphoribosylaminopyrimidine deaminase/5-amino-6-(5-phosphoribosylamino)uracil reductase RibD n=1 Tax=Pseudoxanthomonas suwonensis TaxID=314722 RepID=UPI00048DA202|nr:bifunctional diaminohydroxyphosphoribosylaminopyrimidine deaminase/5-amino-6-(5-phosphoribosylamino)uracil reductase RibD [Pseudoxanthomonas suwonensis]